MYAIIVLTKDLRIFTSINIGLVIAISVRSPSTQRKGARSTYYLLTEGGAHYILQCSIVYSK